MVPMRWMHNSPRSMGAWLGLTPKERSTGGRQRLGGVSRAGDERIRQSLVLGATAVIRCAVPENKAANPLAVELLERWLQKPAALHTG